jgi:hypothetical protein
LIWTVRWRHNVRPATNGDEREVGPKSGNGRFSIAAFVKLNLAYFISFFSGTGFGVGK